MVDALVIRGPFRGTTGYDRHVRGFARALHDLGVGIQLLDLPEWSPSRLPPERRDPWFETMTRPIAARLTLHCCLPPQVLPSRRRIDVNYTMFEATPIPPHWAAASRLVERTVVPTRSSASMWQAGGVAPDRIAISPLGVDAGAFAAITPGVPAASLVGNEEIWQRRRRFLNVSEVIPRKNVTALLRAWLRATTAADDATLILKPGFYARGARQRFAAMLASAQAETGIAAAAAAPIHVIDRLFADADMPAVFAAATHYVSLSFGEGWDQPMVEAGAAGLRLIAPAHSAYLDYLDPSCATLIPSHPVAAGPVAGPELAALVAGATWWEPDEAATVAAIRAAVAGRDEAIASPRNRIVRDLTWERAARRLLQILAEVDQTRARRPFWRGIRRNTSGKSG